MSKPKILVHRQVEEFVRALAPEPKARLLRAMKALPAGETKPLEGRLAGYSRLHSGGYRITFLDRMQNGVRTFHCLYAEQRGLVYELFEQILAEQALKPE